MWLLYFLLSVFSYHSITTIYSAKNKSLINRTSFIITAKNYFLFNVIFLTIIISSLRLPVSDTTIYETFFYSISNSNSFIIDIYFEPGYQIFNKIVSLIHNDFHFYLFVYNIIIWGGICYFLKKYSLNLIYSVWLFLFLGYFDQTFNLLRQYFALAILLYSYKYIEKRFFKKFIIFVLIAMLFHTSAIVFIIAYFTYNLKIKNNRRFILIYFILCFICFISSSLLYKILELTPYGEYLTSEIWSVQEKVSKIAPIMNYLILLTILSCYWVYNKSNDKISNSMYLLVIIASFITILSFRFTPLERISSYFSVFCVILFPNTIKQISNKNKRRFLYTFFFLLFMTRYIIIAYYRPDWAAVYPYKFYFQ